MPTKANQVLETLHIRSTGYTLSMYVMRLALEAQASKQHRCQPGEDVI